MPQCQFPILCSFCVSEKLHRKYSRNWTKQVQKLQFYPDEGRGPNGSRRGARGWPHNRGAWPSPWPRPPIVRPPWSTSNDTPSHIRSFPTENPKGIGKFPERVPQLRRCHRRILRDRSLCSSTLLRWGSTPGSISIGLHRCLRRLHRPHRHLHQPCCLL
jgi:hypothetical protein